MSPVPTLSVLLPVYNGGAYLAQAIESILAQSYKNFELLIINDGSADDSEQIAERYSQVDGRVIVLSQTNQGIGPALNAGLEMARGRYIARMDSDDISHPTRFEKQLAWLSAHPDVGLLGTSIYKIDGAGARVSSGVFYRMTGPNILRWITCFRNPVCHPTVMMSRALLESVGGYSISVLAEDYDLWTRLCEVTHFSNLTEPLLSYRIHPVSFTFQQDRFQERRRGADQSRCVLLGQILGEPVSLEVSGELWSIGVGSGRGVNPGWPLPSVKAVSPEQVSEVSRVLTLLWQKVSATPGISAQEAAWIRIDYLKKMYRLWQPYLLNGYAKEWLGAVSLWDIKLIGHLRAHMRSRM